MRNALAYVPKTQETVVTAAIRQAFIVVASVRRFPGLFDPFAKPSANGHYLRTAAGIASPSHD
jgi:hypothetical protein